MRLSFYRRLFALAVIYGFTANPAFAETVMAEKTNLPWQYWLQNQIEHHPDVMAAKQQLKAQLFLAEGRTQPLYNPAFETEFEREGSSDNYRIGINQTLDVWGKRDNRRQQAEFLRLAAEHTYAQIYQEKLSDALSVLATYQASKARYVLVQQQERHFDTLFQLVKDRQKAGDLGQIDVNVSLASLAQRLNETAEAMADVSTAETRLQAFFPNLATDKTVIPDGLWQVNFESASDSSLRALLDSHPRVLLAKAQWEIHREATALAGLNTKADPTLGINAGREGDENVIGLTFSIPLTVRNTFRAEQKAATEEALSAEASYLAVRRQQQFQIQAATRIARQYQQQLQRLESLLAQSHGQSQKLLEQQWRTGDLSTNDYLLALQQSTAGALSGIELQEKSQLAVINWLKTTGQVKTHILPAQYHLQGRKQ